MLDKGLRISQADGELFRCASHDRNPLHQDGPEARRSAYGEAVVYGVLGTIAALGRSSGGRSGLRPRRVALDFRSPLFFGRDYVLEERARPGGVALVIQDGVRPLSVATISFGPPGPCAPLPEASSDVRSAAARLAYEDLCVGTAHVGSYAPNMVAFRELLARFGLAEQLAPILTPLLAASYVIGMELPGHDAMFTRLELDLEGEGACHPGPLGWRCVVEGREDRYQLLTLGLDFERMGVPLARGGAGAVVRWSPPRPSAQALRQWHEASLAFRDKLVIVTGASRGLGAGLALGFAQGGAHVIATHRASPEDARLLLAEAADLPGPVELVQADAADPGAMEAVRRVALDARGRVDFLIVNAFPPLRALDFAPGSIDRLVDFIRQGVACGAAPLATFCGDLNSAGGRVVVISTALLSGATAAARPPAEVSRWPHYAAAKAALESLAASASHQFSSTRFVVVRPPRMATGMVATPLGRVGAEPVEPVVARILKTLAEPRAPGLEFLDWP